MGITHVALEIASPANMEAWETVECPVDSGATRSLVPAALLDRLGIQPVGEEVFRLANGETIRRRRGIAAFRYEERVGGSDVIFGEEGDMNLVGVLTLESLGLALDPLRRELRPLPMLLAHAEVAP
jgi:hypothetical protein